MRTFDRQNRFYVVVVSSKLKQSYQTSGRRLLHICDTFYFIILYKLQHIYMYMHLHNAAVDYLHTTYISKIRLHFANFNLVMWSILDQEIENKNFD